MPVCRAMGAVVRASLVALATTIAAIQAAAAAEASHPEVIGFSADGAFVAFEEYGVQDGSGFPYANIFIIDVAANDWVAGSPVRVLLTDEDMAEEAMMRRGLEQARRRARGEAQPILNAHGIVAGNAGTPVIYHPYSDLGADPYSARFSITANDSPSFLGDVFVLKLSLREASAPECAGLTPPPTKIFTLEMARNDEAPVVLQRDTRLFASRGCPLDYRIHSVYLLPVDVPPGATCCASRYSMLVLVGMGTFGFEGPDWRLLGVTGRLER